MKRQRKSPIKQQEITDRLQQYAYAIYILVWHKYTDLYPYSHAASALRQKIIAARNTTLTQYEEDKVLEQAIEHLIQQLADVKKRAYTELTSEEVVGLEQYILSHFQRLLFDAEQVEQEEPFIAITIQKWLRNWWQEVQAIVPYAMIESVNELQVFDSMQMLLRTSAFPRSSPSTALSALDTFHEQISEMYTGMDAMTLQRAMESTHTLLDSFKWSYIHAQKEGNDQDTVDESYIRLAQLYTQLQRFLFLHFQGILGAFPRAIRQLDALNKGINAIVAVEQPPPNLHAYRKAFERQVAEARTELVGILKSWQLPLLGNPTLQREQQKIYQKLCLTVQSHLVDVGNVIAARFALALLEWANLYKPGEQISPSERLRQEYDFSHKDLLEKLFQTLTTLNKDEIIQADEVEKLREAIQGVQPVISPAMKLHQRLERAGAYKRLREVDPRRATMLQTYLTTEKSAADVGKEVGLRNRTQVHQLIHSAIELAFFALPEDERAAYDNNPAVALQTKSMQQKQTNIERFRQSRINSETGKIELSATHKQHIKEGNQRRSKAIAEGTYTGRPLGGRREPRPGKKIGRPRKSGNTST